jgi:hypothetical protein
MTDHVPTDASVVSNQDQQAPASAAPVEHREAVSDNYLTASMHAKVFQQNETSITTNIRTPPVNGDGTEPCMQHASHNAMSETHRMQVDVTTRGPAQGHGMNKTLTWARTISTDDAEDENLNGDPTMNSSRECNAAEGPEDSEKEPFRWFARLVMVRIEVQGIQMYSKGNQWCTLFDTTVLWTLLVSIIVLALFATVCNEYWHPVDDGAMENKFFMFGVIPTFTLIVNAAHIATINVGMPRTRFCWRKNVAACVVSTAIGVSMYYLVTFVGISEEPRFPVPLSVLVTTWPAPLTTLLTLYVLTPERHKVVHDFQNMVGLFGAHWLALVVAIGWASGINRTKKSPGLQLFVAFLFPFLRWICKIPIAARLAMRLNPRKAIYLNHVVDYIFTTVLCSTFPFIKTGDNMGWMTGSNLGTIAWRVLFCVDRLNHFFCNQKPCEDEDTSEKSPSYLRRIVSGFSSSFGVSAQEVHKMSMQNMNLSNVHTLSHWNNNSSNHSLETNIFQTILSQDCAKDNGMIQDADPNMVIDLEDDNEGAHVAADIFRPSRDQVTSVGYDDTDETFEGRYLFHALDSMMPLVIYGTTSLILYILNIMVRHLSSKKHLNSSFDIDDELWKESLHWGMITIGLCIVILIIAGIVSQQQLRQFPITVPGILLYAVKEHFSLYFLWACVGSILCVAAMTKHFGFDFSMQMEWLTCLGDTAWPGCQNTTNRTHSN